MSAATQQPVASPFQMILAWAQDWPEWQRDDQLLSGARHGLTLYIAGNGRMDIAGTFYAPDALVDVAGSGVNIIGSRYISYRLDMRGSGTYRVLWNPDLLDPVRTLKLVE